MPNRDAEQGGNASLKRGITPLGHAHRSVLMLARETGKLASRRGSGKRGKISNHLKKKPAIGAVLHIPNTSKDQSLVIATHRAA